MITVRARFFHLLLASVLGVATAACGSAPAKPETVARVAGLAPALDGLLPAEQSAFAAAGVDPATLACVARQRWSQTLRPQAKFTADQILDELSRAAVVVPDDKRDAVRKKLIDTVFWRMVLTQLVDGDMHNLGASRLGELKDASGKPLVLVRTGFTPDPAQADSCVQSLVGKGGVRHIVNLYAGPMPTDGLEKAERAAVEAVGGTYYTARQDPGGNWREDLREGDGGEAKRAAMAAVAQLIHSQVLRPGGQPPKGNVHIHCGGGMHRTGMVVGVIERCLNQLPAAQVADHYKRHVGWRSDKELGGFEPENLKFIEEFDCGLLKP